MNSTARYRTRNLGHASWTRSSTSGRRNSIGNKWKLGVRMSRRHSTSMLAGKNACWRIDSTRYGSIVVVGEDERGRLFRLSSGSTRCSSRTPRRVRKSIPYAWRDNATKISIRSRKRAFETCGKNCSNASNARSMPTTYGRVDDEHGVGVRLVVVFCLERTPTRRPSFCRVSRACEIQCRFTSAYLWNRQGRYG